LFPVDLMWFSAPGLTKPRTSQVSRPKETDTVQQFAFTADRCAVGLDPGLTNAVPDGPASQSHEIIRTWAFYTIAKAMLHEGKVSAYVAISLDSRSGSQEDVKSKGNVVTPMQLLDVGLMRSGIGRLGAVRVHTAFDLNVLKVGAADEAVQRRQFVLGQPGVAGAITYEMT
jgi:hypothetical protein